jgi:crotonobetainyl-CoA:carnitine CoA-transferase CaiB-like acyl-CoA transferase
LTILSSAAPHGAYQYQGEDNWIAIVCFDNLEWNVLCEESVIINDPMFASLAKRVNSNVRRKILHG